MQEETESEGTDRNLLSYTFSDMKLPRGSGMRSADVNADVNGFDGQRNHRLNAHCVSRKYACDWRCSRSKMHFSPDSSSCPNGGTKHGRSELCCVIAKHHTLQKLTLFGITEEAKLAELVKLVQKMLSRK